MRGTAGAVGQGGTLDDDVKFDARRARAHAGRRRRGGNQLCDAAAGGSPRTTTSYAAAWRGVLEWVRARRRR